MTHSIIFEIRFDSFKGADEFKNNILSYGDFWELYGFKFDNFRGSPGGRNCQPFIYFTDIDDADDEFSIYMSTGSHVSREDTLEALQFYFFTVCFREYFKEQLRGLKFGYHKDGEIELKGDDWIIEGIGREIFERFLKG